MDGTRFIGSGSHTFPFDENPRRLNGREPEDGLHSDRSDQNLNQQCMGHIPRVKKFPMTGPPIFTICSDHQPPKNLQTPLNHCPARTAILCAGSNISVGSSHPICREKSAAITADTDSSAYAADYTGSAGHAADSPQTSAGRRMKFSEGRDDDLQKYRPSLFGSLVEVPF